MHMEICDGVVTLGCESMSCRDGLHVIDTGKCLEIASDTCCNIEADLMMQLLVCLSNDLQRPLVAFAFGCFIVLL